MLFGNYSGTPASVNPYQALEPDLKVVNLNSAVGV